MGVEGGVGPLRRKESDKRLGAVKLPPLSRDIAIAGASMDQGGLDTPPRLSSQRDIVPWPNTEGAPGPGICDSLDSVMHGGIIDASSAPTEMTRPPSRAAAAATGN